MNMRHTLPFCSGLVFLLQVQSCTGAGDSSATGSDCSDTDTDDYHGLAPTFVDHINDPPDLYVPCWILVSLACIINYFIIINHYNRMIRRGRQLRNDEDAMYIPLHVRLTSRIVLLPLFITVLSLGTVFIPRQAPTWEFLKVCYEAYAFMGFYQLLVHYCGGPKALVQEMNKREHNIQFWAPNHSPCRCFVLCYYIPCCCCASPYKRQGDEEEEQESRKSCTALAPDEITVHKYKVAEKLIVQFCFIVPVLAVVSIVDTTSKLETVLDYGTMVSTIVCMYGLFIFLNLTSPIAEECGIKTHGKFVAIKFTLVVSTLLLAVLNQGLDESYCGYPVHTITEAYAATIASFMMIPIAFLMKRNFPVEEFDTITAHDQENPLSHSRVSNMEDSQLLKAVAV